MIFKKGFLNFIICYNDDFAPLARNCCRSLSHDLININAYKVLDLKSKWFRSQEWYYIARKKIELLYELYNLCEDNEIIAFVDSDVQFLNSQKIVDIWKIMDQSSFLFVGQAEACCEKNSTNLWLEVTNGGPQANGGFYMVKKSKEISELFDYVLSIDFTTRFLADQKIINEYLFKFKIKRALLNPCLFFHGCCGDLNINNNMLYHHATCTSNHLQKMDQINNFRKILRIEPVNWEDSSFGKSTNLFNI